jgi:hypothetical protein
VNSGLRRWWPLPVVLVLIWAVLGYFLTKPPDFHDYRRAAVQAAESGYNALATAQMTVQEQLAGKTTGRFTDGTLQRSSDTLAGAWKEFAAATPVDDATEVIRDELGPLLLSAVTVLGNLRVAEDVGGGATARALDAVDPVAEQLNDFVDRHK